MIFDGPIGGGALSLAVYRRADGFYRTTGTTFVDSATVADAVWRTGLLAATEKLSASSKGTGVYAWTPPTLPAGTYSIVAFADHDDLLPDGTRESDTGTVGKYLILRFVLNVGSEGQALNLANLETDVQLSSEDISALAGEISAAIGDLGIDTTAIAQAVAGLLAGMRFVVHSTVLADGTIELDQGDDYAAADDREIVLRVANYTGPDLDGDSYHLALCPTAPHVLGQAGDVLVLDGSAAMDDTDAVFTFTATAAQTATLETSPPDQPLNYRYKVRMTKSSRKITILRGAATVHRDLFQ